MQRITVPGQPKQIVQETPISKITRAKWTGGMAQAIEHLLCKCEALSSNPSLTKKKKNSCPTSCQERKNKSFQVACMPPGVREFQFIARSGNEQVSWSKVKIYPFVEI
jgi:hypothetical protein